VPVFQCFSQEIDPGTPLDRPGAPRTSICTKNQPRRPILRPCRGDAMLCFECQFGCTVICRSSAGVRRHSFALQWRHGNPAAQFRIAGAACSGSHSNKLIWSHSELPGYKYGSRGRFWEGNPIQMHPKLAPRGRGLCPRPLGAGFGCICIGSSSKAIPKPAPEAIFTPRKLY